jgi:transposase-like protein
MLVELSIVEQRYQAVLAVIRDGVPIVQVAHRYDVSRQAVHRWLRWYEGQCLRAWSTARTDHPGAAIRAELDDLAVERRGPEPPLHVLPLGPR